MYPCIDKSLIEYNQPIGCFHVSEKQSEFFSYQITHLSEVMLVWYGKNEGKMRAGEGRKESANMTQREPIVGDSEYFSVPLFYHAGW